MQIDINGACTLQDIKEGHKKISYVCTDELLAVVTYFLTASHLLDGNSDVFLSVELRDLMANQQIEDFVTARFARLFSVSEALRSVQVLDDSSEIVDDIDSSLEDGDLE